MIFFMRRSILIRSGTAALDPQRANRNPSGAPSDHRSAATSIQSPIGLSISSALRGSTAKPLHHFGTHVACTGAAAGGQLLPARQ